MFSNNVGLGVLMFIGMLVRVAFTLLLGLRVRKKIIATPIILAAKMCGLGNACINFLPLGKKE
jgi:hypothetical protein